MKTFLKYLTLAVVIALSATFMANTHKTETNTKAENPPPCWIEPQVTLQGECVNYNQNTQYVINIKIYNTCNNPATLLFDDTQTFPTDNGNPFFCISDTICVTDTGEDCFKVVTSAAKVSTVNSEVYCSGQSVSSYDCEKLTNLTNLYVLMY